MSWPGATCYGAKPAAAQLTSCSLMGKVAVCPFGNQSVMLLPVMVHGCPQQSDDWGLCSVAGSDGWRHLRQGTAPWSAPAPVICTVICCRLHSFALGAGAFFGLPQ